MNIRDFAFNLQKVYEEMSATFSAYQSGTGLNCLSGCGRCCMNPEIEASVLEMIPFALKVYDQGQLDDWLLKIESNPRPYCILFQDGEIPGKGACQSYNERPSVCRMFGVAGTLNKHREITHSICKYIKEAYPEGAIPSEKTPLIPVWSARLASLDPELVTKKFPINVAIKKALEKIALYAQYQGI